MSFEHDKRERLAEWWSSGMTSCGEKKYSCTLEVAPCCRPIWVGTDAFRKTAAGELSTGGGNNLPKVSRVNTTIAGSTGRGGGVWCAD